MGCDTLPFPSPKAASSIVGSICPRRKNPRSPPDLAVPGSSETSAAIFANLSPETTMRFLTESMRALPALSASESGVGTIWMTCKCSWGGTFGLGNGKVSQPIRTPYGWHLIETIERDTVRGPDGKDSLGTDGKAIQEVHARHILVKVTPNDDDVQRAQTLAQNVREQAAKGGDFAALVRKYSTYRGPSSADGDVGFLSLASLQPGIRAGLEPLKVGEVSQVLPNAQGFNIFKVLEKKPERDYELAEIKQELPDAVADAQFRDKYEAWLKTLRSKAQIEYRNL